MNTITLDIPDFSDIEELNLFFSAVISDTFQKEVEGNCEAFILEEIEEKKVFLHEALASKGEKRFFLLAKKDQKIVGTIAYGPCGELIIEGSKGAYQGVGEIGTVFVLPEFQNQGIGGTMLSAMLLELSNRSIQEFCLDSGYPRAQKIWQHKFGTPTIVMKDHWGEGNDHMIWYIKL